MLDPGVGVNEWCYDTQCGKPAEDVIEGWIQNYLDLEWIPGLKLENSLNPIVSGRKPVSISGIIKLFIYDYICAIYS